jgi:hypothetical protein
MQDRLDDAYRAMSVSEKIARMVALTALAHSMALARIRTEYPGESARHHRIRLASRWLSREQLLNAFGWREKCDADSP